MTKPSPVITDAELSLFLADQELLRQTTNALNQLKKVCDAREEELMARLKAGAKTSTRFAASIGETQRRITPWKEVARSLWTQLKFDPDVMEEKTKELTKPTIYTSLIVVEIGTAPFTFGRKG